MLSTIAVGTDGSATAAEAVKVAADMARRFDSKLVLISAVPSPGLVEDDRGGAEEIQWAFNPASRTREILARAEEEVQAEILLVHEELHVEPVEPAIDVPVHVAEVVTVAVRPVV